MFQPSPSATNFLDTSNSEYLLASLSGDKGCLCEIRDKATGIIYASAIETTEPAALDAAVEAAKKVSKPKSASSGSDAELEALRAQLAEVKLENKVLKTKATKEANKAKNIEAALTEDNVGDSPKE